MIANVTTPHDKGARCDCRSCVRRDPSRNPWNTNGRHRLNHRQERVA